MQSFRPAVALRTDSNVTVGYPPYVNQLYGGEGIKTLGCSGKTGGFQSLYEISAEQVMVEGVTRGVGQVRCAFGVTGGVGQVRCAFGVTGACCAVWRTAPATCSAP
jgi:hypothetical protein